VLIVCSLGATAKVAWVCSPEVMAKAAWARVARQRWSTWYGNGMLTGSNGSGMGVLTKSDGKGGMGEGGETKVNEAQKHSLLEAFVCLKTARSSDILPIN
jgi:hypothetical protein